MFVILLTPNIMIFECFTDSFGLPPVPMPLYSSSFRRKAVRRTYALTSLLGENAAQKLRSGLTVLKV
jgi:hypothetical protein